MKAKYAIVISLAMILLTVMALKSVNDLDHYGSIISDQAVPALIEAEAIAEYLLLSSDNINAFYNSGDTDALSDFDSNINTVIKKLNMIKDNEILQGKEALVASAINTTKTLADNFRSVAQQIQAIGKKDSGMIGEFREATHKTETIIKEQNNDALMVQLLMMRRHEKDFLLRKEAKYVEKMKKTLDEFNSVLANSGIGEPALSKIQNNMKEYQAGFAKVASAVLKLGDKKIDVEAGLFETTSGVHELVVGISAIVDKQRNEFTEAKSRATRNLLVSAIILTILVSFIAIRLASSITRKIQGAVNVLSQLSAKTSEQGNRLKEESNRLNSASIQQAAATQETAASMTEMESMISSTADEAQKGNENVNNMNQIAEESEKSASHLQASMTELTQSKEDLEKVLEVIRGVSERTNMINDIVFKTQLLSFNASIEAARAGQHGRGFSVVAEEIAQLANTSGAAAREIEQLTTQGVAQVQAVVESVNSKVDNGKVVTEQMMANFNTLRQNMRSVLESISSITNATNEQQLGIQQSNEAIAQMDEAISQFTNSATQVSNSSEELGELNEQINNEVKNIEAIITGGKNRSKFEETKPAKALGGGILSAGASSIDTDSFDLEDEISADDFDRAS
jgi:methyl-accepting chemotaxis protein